MNDAPHPLLLRRASVPDGVQIQGTHHALPLPDRWPTETLCDIAMRDGTIASVVPHDPEATPTGATLDLAGRCVLPAFIDAHMHIDKAYTFAIQPNLSGTLSEAIGIFGSIGPTLTRQNYGERAEKVVRNALAAGTTTIRTHVDVSAHNGLTGLEAVLEVRERWRGIVDIQTVVLNARLLGAGCARDRDLYAEALRMGANIAGGCPGLFEDEREHIDTVFALAQRFDCAVDLHVDETDNPTALSLEYLADKTASEGMQGRVVAGHCCSLASAPDDVAARIIDKVARARIHVVTLPACNLYLQGRGDRHPVRRGLTRVKDLLAAGINVVCASDNVQDPFNPFGTADPVLVSYLLALGAHMGGVAEQREVLRMWTSRAAALLGQTDQYGIAPGCAANMVVFDRPTIADIIADQPRRYAVFSKGRLVSGMA